MDNRGRPMLREKTVKERRENQIRETLEARLSHDP